jgi:hypothetical protein
MKVLAVNGVCRKLVHAFPAGDGYQISEPVFDNSSFVAGVGTEGTAINATAVQTITTTRRIYTATEQTAYTKETYQSVEDGSESVREFHSSVHGHAHAKKLEQKILACFASFTPAVAATSATGLTWGKIAAARTLLEMATTPAPKPYGLVVSPNVWYYFTQNTSQNSTYGPIGTVADDIMKKFHIGSIVGGVEVYQTPYLAAAASSVCGLFAKEAIGLFVPREFRLDVQMQALARGYDLVSTLRAGARVRKASWGVKVTAMGSDPS